MFDATSSYDLALILAAGVLGFAIVGYLAIPAEGADRQVAPRNLNREQA